MPTTTYHGVDVGSYSEYDGFGAAPHVSTDDGDTTFWYKNNSVGARGTKKDTAEASVPADAEITRVQVYAKSRAAPGGGGAPKNIDIRRLCRTGASLYSGTINSDVTNTSYVLRNHDFTGARAWVAADVDPATLQYGEQVIAPGEGDCDERVTWIYCEVDWELVGGSCFKTDIGLWLPPLLGLGANLSFREIWAVLKGIQVKYERSGARVMKVLPAFKGEFEAIKKVMEVRPRFCFFDDGR